MTENIVLDKSIEFALGIIKFTEHLESKRKFKIADQLLRSGTSIGANIHEAQNPESRADFIHKMKIAAKEAKESKYWLTLCRRAESYPYDQELDLQLESLEKIIYKIIISSKKKQ